MGTLLTHLRLGSAPASLRLADVGAGTGNFTAALARAARLSTPPLCVDFSEDMLALARRSQYPPLETLCLDAVAFSRVSPSERAYDRLLLKEVVHHIPEPEVAPMFAGFFAQLRPGGVCCVVTRPQEVDYPLFGAARAVWRENQPPAALYVAAMERAGFRVAQREAVFPATLPKPRWLRMVRSRFWSTFSHFSDEELEAGIREIEAEYEASPWEEGASLGDTARLGVCVEARGRAAEQPLSLRRILASAGAGRRRVQRHASVPHRGEGRGGRRGRRTGVRPQPPSLREPREA